MDIKRNVNGVEMLFPLSLHELHEAFIEADYKYFLFELEDNLELLNEQFETVNIDNILADKELCSLIKNEYEEQTNKNQGEIWLKLLQKYIQQL